MKKIDAVLPLTLKDFARFKLLYKTMTLFKDLNTCWVITKDNEFKEIKSRIKDKKYKVIKETSIVPEFKNYKTLGGWYKQQLLKFAIAKKIESDFYLILDADLICVRTVRYSDLITNGKALSQIEKVDFHPEWYKDAERILGLKRSGLKHGVTPALFCKEGVLNLQDFLNKRASSNAKKINWRMHLIKHLPWTEYTLYFTFMEGIGLFQKYYNKPAKENICGNLDSVWFKKDVKKFDPEKIFKKKKYFFIVFQSTTGINSNELWSKISKYYK